MQLLIAFVKQIILTILVEIILVLTFIDVDTLDQYFSTYKAH